MLVDRTIYNADNLLVMSRMPGDSVDLIYLDPPFNSGKQWENPLKETGKKVSFKDTWTLADIHEDERDILALRYPGAAAVIDALALTNGGSWSAYLTYMGVRLAQMRRILKPTGSIYYHCDPTMSHGVKLLMDAIFGKSNFRNEIVWAYTGPANVKAHFPRKHDIILFYAKSPAAPFYKEAVRIKHRRQHVSAGATGMAGGRRTPAEIRRQEKIALQKGKVAESHWTDIGAGSHMPKAERVGYPTEKPVALLRRILKASSKPDDIVLDPFCGCGVTATAAEIFMDERRRWMGIDIGTEAAAALRKKLNECGAHLFGAMEIPKVQTLDEKDLPDLPPIPNKKTVKAMLYRGQGSKCNGCQQAFGTGVMDIDHILPRTKGGDNDIANLQLLCRECNNKKGTKTMTELRRRIAAERVEKKMRAYRDQGAKRLANEKQRAIAKAEKQGRLT